MLAEEVTIGIYPEGVLNDILIEPDGHEFHLFLTGTKRGFNDYTKPDKPLSLGSIVFINEDWIYEGQGLSHESQAEIADFIKNY